jgi:membrane protein implicated in regulation of membrane protease activity
MSGQRKKKVRKKRMRSYRKAKLFLWAFGSAGLALGLGLFAWFGLQRNWQLAGVGFAYILVSLILFGIRGVLVHLDDDRKRRREFRTGSRRES